MTSARKIAQQLINLNIKVHKISEWSDIEDGEIKLNDGYHVQVGIGYLCLNKSIYNSKGELNSVRYILEDTTVVDIVKYFWENE